MTVTLTVTVTNTLIVPRSWESNTDFLLTRRLHFIGWQSPPSPSPSHKPSLGAALTLIFILASDHILIIIISEPDPSGIPAAPLQLHLISRLIPKPHHEPDPEVKSLSLSLSCAVIPEHPPPRLSLTEAQLLLLDLIPAVA